jgi:hypothetical protein
MRSIAALSYRRLSDPRFRILVLFLSFVPIHLIIEQAGIGIYESNWYTLIDSGSMAVA